MSERTNSEGQRGKIDEDDHDLLTFGEAGERLRIAVASAQKLVAELEKTGPREEYEKAKARLEMLTAGSRRNAAQPINDANFERFFGYPGKATRNLP